MEWSLNPKNINSLKQNKPKYIARDLSVFGIPKEITHTILLARGIYKWLAVREKLIKLKNEWKDEITQLNNELQRLPKGSKERKILAERWRTLVRCREQIRELCHSTRWQAPERDKEAKEFLEKLTQFWEAVNEDRSL